MNRIDDYVEAVTRRLRADAELHMDIAHEVRAHLEDAAAEAREGGLSEEDAAEQALKAFGDEEEVSDGLWRANRRRMRMRAVIRWAARLTLVPGLVLLTAALAGTCLPPLVRALGAAFVGEDMFSAAARIAGPLRPRRGLTPDELFVFRHCSGDLKDAMALAEHDPRALSFHAQYVLALSGGWFRLDQRPALREKSLLALERAKQLEPDNAFYNYLKAALLMSESSRLLDRQGIRYTYVGRRGEEQETRASAIAILDSAAFGEAVREVREGTVKPYFDSHAGDALELKMKLMETPTTLAEWVSLRAEAAGLLMPHLARLRCVCHSLPAYAALLATEGKLEQALEMVSVMDRPSIQMGAGSRWLIELLVARSGLSTSQGQAPEVLRMAGRPDLAGQAQATFEREQAAWNALWAGSEKIEALARSNALGLLGGAFLPAVPLEDTTWIPVLREAEHVLVGYCALAVVLGVMTLLLLVLGVLTLRDLWRYRGGDDRPKLFFVGWRRSGGIVVAGVILPLAAYWAYTRFASTSSLRHGINYSWPAALLELAILTAAMLLAVLALGYRAIRARCREAGMDVSGAGVLNPLEDPRGALLAMALAAAVPAALAGLLFAFDTPFKKHALLGILVPGALILLPIVCLRWQLWRLKERAGSREFARTYMRSLLPVVAGCLLLTGLIGWTGLRHAESSRIRALQTPEGNWAVEELPMTSLVKYRDHLRELERQWRAGGDAYGVKLGTRAGPAAQPQNASSTSPATMESVAGTRTAQPVSR
jgi:multisubunit Na+/H+ antiporter MnhB subunit